MNLETTSLILVYGAMAAYTLGMFAFAIDFSSADKTNTRTAGNIGMSLTTLAFALHLAGTILRGIAASRVPWANMYEFTLSFSVIAVGAYLVVSRSRDLRVLGVFVNGLTLLALGSAVAVLYVRVQGTPPILDHYWLIIHVSTATIAMGLFVFAALMSVLQLIQIRKEANATAKVTAGGGGDVVVEEKKSRWRDLPSAADLEHGAFRVTVVGFLLWTFTLIAGAIWAEHAWGRPWNWDPKETMSLVVWGFYGAYLHARATRGWEGKRAAWLNVIGLLSLFINYYVINFFADSLHSYAGV